MATTQRRRRIALLVGLAFGLVILVTAWQALVVRTALLSAREDLRSMAQHVDDGDQQAVADAVARAEDATSRADWHSHTPVWWVSQYLPLVGDEVEAVRVVSAAAHDLTEGVVMPLVEAGLTPDQFRPQNGRIPIEPLRRAEVVLGKAAPRVAEAEESIGGLSTSELLGPVRGPVEELQPLIADAARVTRAAAVATQLLPGMLGGDGDRTYVLAFQNNAEARATGGMPGTLGVLSARDGRLSMDRTLSPITLENGEPVAQGSPAEQELFGQRMLLRARAANVTPHFPRFADLLSAFWERSGRAPLDGVLAIDPVALSYLMEYTGPVALEGGEELTSDNVGSALLKDVYRDIPEGQQDAYFGDAAERIFDAIIEADGSSEALIGALGRSIDERRLAVWPADPEEQELLGGEDVANELPQDIGRPEVGIYSNDVRADKLSYYLHADPSVTSESCSTEGVQALTVTMSIRSTAPESGLTRYVTGFRDDGLPRYLMRHDFLLVAPAGGEIQGLTIDDRPISGPAAELDGRPAMVTAVDLRPGQSRTLRYEVLTGEGQSGDIRVLTTPLADGTGGESLVDSGC